MTYTIDIPGITALVHEEVSRVAGMAYSDDGASLYDSIAIRSRDADTVSRMIRDAVDAIVARTADICTYIPSPQSLSLFAPDMDNSKEGAVEEEITRAISLGAVATWLSERLPARAKEYSDRANNALNIAISLLKTRKLPTRT